MGPRRSVEQWRLLGGAMAVLGGARARKPHRFAALAVGRRPPSVRLSQSVRCPADWTLGGRRSNPHLVEWDDAGASPPQHCRDCGARTRSGSAPCAVGDGGHPRCGNPNHAARARHGSHLNCGPLARIVRSAFALDESTQNSRPMDRLARAGLPVHRPLCGADCTHSASPARTLHGRHTHHSVCRHSRSPTRSGDRCTATGWIHCPAARCFSGSVESASGSPPSPLDTGRRRPVHGQPIYPATPLSPVLGCVGAAVCGAGNSNRPRSWNAPHHHLSHGLAGHPARPRADASPHQTGHAGRPASRHCHCDGPQSPPFSLGRRGRRRLWVQLENHRQHRSMARSA